MKIKAGLAILGLGLGLALAGCGSGGGSSSSITGAANGSFTFTPLVGTSGIDVTATPNNFIANQVTAEARNNQTGSDSGVVNLGVEQPNVFSGLLTLPIVISDTYTITVTGYDVTGQIVGSERFQVTATSNGGTNGGGTNGGSTNGNTTATTGTTTTGIPPIPGPPPFPTS